jgi:Flp pilus assembly protein TadG
MWHPKMEKFMNGVRRTKSKENGQSMVELALTITFLMMLLAGTIDLGRAFFVWLGMRDAAQEGASYASINPTDGAGISSRMEYNYDQVIRDPDADIYVEVTFSGPQCLGSTPSVVTVEIDYTNFKITVPFLGMFIGDTIPIHATINDTVVAPLCH